MAATSIQVTFLSEHCFIIFDITQTDLIKRYLEQRFGEGTVRKMNGCLHGKDYDEKKLFGDCCGGRKVEDLW
jgi:hypothetical protein